MQRQMTLRSYLELLDEAFSLRRYARAARLLSLKDMHTMCAQLSTQNAVEDAYEFLPEPYGEIVGYHMQVLSYSLDPLEAVSSQLSLLKIYTAHLRAQPGNQTLPLLFTFAADLRLLAYRSLSSLTEAKGEELLEKTAEGMMAVFRVCTSDTKSAIPDSKRWGLMALVNQLFRIYFRLKKLKLCDALAKAIDNVPFSNDFPISQMVTYKYFIGKKAMFESDYKRANEHLTFAFEHCHRDSIRNKRRILIYLVPVRILLGMMPKDQLLRRYRLPEYTAITAAVRAGDLVAFDEALEANEAFFIRAGIFLILERLKGIAYRNLFHKVFRIIGSNQLNISAFTTALRLMRYPDIDDEETQCLIANLIYDNQIKGYISLQHNKLVVSKQDPFPTLASVI